MKIDNLSNKTRTDEQLHFGNRHIYIFGLMNGFIESKNFTDVILERCYFDKTKIGKT